jgi:hypothetical protein
MNAEEFTPEPKQTWRRKNFDPKLLHGRTERERAEMETNRDLSKPVEQLVCDFHDMAELVMDPKSPNAANVNWFLIQAQKRMVSMMGRVALEHKRSSNWLVVLTWVVGFLTVALLAATILLLRVAHRTDERIHEIYKIAEAQQHQTQPPGAGAPPY